MRFGRLSLRHEGVLGIGRQVVSLFHTINPVDETKLSCYASHRRSTTVSLETYPSIRLIGSLVARDLVYIQCCSGEGNKSRRTAHRVQRDTNFKVAQ